ncbi:MAG: O-antigen ligase family protein [Opitutae bacterium]|nr:O-antigen ligase family protein [Opitutae bacterium]
MIERENLSLYGELRSIYRYLKTKEGRQEGCPVLWVLASAFLVAMLPISVYQLKCAFFIGTYSINYLELLMPFLMLPALMRVKKNRLMLGFFFIFVVLGLVTAPLAVKSPLNALIVGAYTGLPFLYISCIQFTPFQKDLLKWGALALCLGLGLQVLIYGLGFKSYVSDYSGESLGVVGAVSRVGSTVGAATGTAVYIFISAVFSGVLFVRRPLVFWAILIFAAITILISQSRGSLLMIVLFTAALGLPLLKESTSRGGGFILRVVLLVCALCSAGGFLYFRPDVVEQWRKRVDYFRGDAFDDAGRGYRFAMAYETFKDSNGFGVGLGNYSARKKIMPFGADVVGISSPHNVYLLLLAETGVIGLISYLMLIGGVLLRAFKAGRHMVLVGLLIILFIGHNVEYVYLHSPFLWVFALLLAYACHSGPESGRPPETLRR